METKQCSRCEEVKSIKHFRKRYNQCKTCDYKIIQLRYRTKNGLISKLFFSRYGLEKKYKKKLQYSQKEFTEWILKQKTFHTLYDIWIKNNYEKQFMPSIGKKDYMQESTLNNLYISTFIEVNKRARKLKAKKGPNIKLNKKVAQYTKVYKLIKIYPSIKQAEFETNINAANISSCCRNKRPTAGGFIWKYI